MNGNVTSSNEETKSVRGDEPGVCYHCGAVSETRHPGCSEECFRQHVPDLSKKVSSDFRAMVERLRTGESA